MEDKEIIEKMQQDEIDMFFNTPIKGWSNNPCGICLYKNILMEVKEMLEVIIEQTNVYPLKNNLIKVLQKIEVKND